MGERSRLEFETLYALCEVTVALAGFAAIVVLFKRNDSGRWRPADADTAMAAQVAGHSWKISSRPSSTPLVRMALAVPLGVMILQLLNVAGVICAGEFQPYLTGVLWQVLQSGALFLSLVFVRSADTSQIDA